MKAWWVFPLAALLTASRAGAEVRTYLVEVVAAGPAEPIAALEQRTRSLLREYPVVIDWSVRAAFRPRDVFVTVDHESLTRIWLDLRDPAQAVLYVVDDAHEHFLVRVVPLDAGYDEVAGESLGTIIQSSVETLLAGATLGVSREAAEEQVSALEGPEKPAEPPPTPVPEPAATPQSAPAAPRRPYRLALDVGYRGQLWTDGTEILHGPEGGLSFVRPKARWSVAGFASAGYRAPLSWNESGVGARFEGLGVRAGSGVRLMLGSRASLALLGSVGVDGLEVRPSATDATAEDSFWIGVPTAGGAAELTLELARSWSVWLSAGADVDLMGHHFDVEEDGRRVTVLQPWRVQPVLRLGLRVLP